MQQINSFYYERLLASRDKGSVRSEIKRHEPGPAPNDIIKDPYVLEFLDIKENKKYLEYLLPGINDYFYNKLKLKPHPDKVFIKTLSSGVDFLGWVNFSDHRVLRAKTTNRMLKKIKCNSNTETINSYLGLLKHGNTYKIKGEI